jgi:hypothetical protein
MRRPAALTLAFLLGSACVDEPEAVTGVRTLSDDARVAVLEEMASAPAPDICDLLPPGCGACSVACDWEALEEYVPAGTCAAFVCELVDGRKATFHACHPPDHAPRPEAD